MTGNDANYSVKNRLCVSFQVGTQHRVWLYYQWCENPLEFPCQNRETPPGLPTWQSGKIICLPMQEMQFHSGSGRSPGGGNDDPFQYSFLKNLMDREVWQVTIHGVTKSWTLLSTCTQTCQNQGKNVCSPSNICRKNHCFLQLSLPLLICIFKRFSQSAEYQSYSL